MKKILVLNGSPRRQGNTDMLVNAFKNGAEQAGASVQVVNVASLKIGGCKACDYCTTHGHVCVQKDDMTDILEAAKQADALVVASPMYFYGLTGQVKCAYDRLHAMGESNIKQTGMLLCCADESKSAFEGVIAAQKKNAAFDGWEYVGDVQAVNVSGKGDVMNTNYLEEAEALGETFAK